MPPSYMRRPFTTQQKWKTLTWSSSWLSLGEMCMPEITWKENPSTTPAWDLPHISASSSTRVSLQFKVHCVPSVNTPWRANMFFPPPTTIVDTPLSLQQISRVAVRRVVGKKAGEVLSKLGLPSRIIRFLSYMPPQIFHIESRIGTEGYV